jgi:hypothetical protein
VWEIIKDRTQEDPANVSDDLPSRVGHKEEHSRVNSVDLLLGFESQPLPGLWVEVGSLDVKEMPRIKFRTKDDDGEVYYEGWLHDDDDCANQEAALSYAMTDAGCTTIEVLRNGKWVQEIA